ncbi:hypothetical protein BD626DRAFT_501786 [Schizophyllum amplum]|uniref:Uncharacterized protein n=1 Tax=Schizophyllum amplum TaxID=97359 RepID=A0A550CA38_9AGAR|nr:hypothetical protein BD626DRAFT_501786 [Auriculariopsis ampla]
MNQNDELLSYTFGEDNNTPSKSGDNGTMKDTISRVPGEDPLTDPEDLTLLDLAPAPSVGRRTLPAAWSIIGSRVLIPVYQPDAPPPALPHYTHRIAFRTFRTIGECCTFPGRVSDGLGAEVPIGYDTLERIIRDAKIGKIIARVDLDRGRVKRVPKDECISRTFWVADLEGIRDDAQAKRLINDLEGEQRESTQEEILVQEATRSQAVPAA